tara:strand:+ start:1159 stop:1392 length:234 start_codon:yes stop_codon:yes gene_type:complete
MIDNGISEDDFQRCTVIEKSKIWKDPNASVITKGNTTISIQTKTLLKNLNTDEWSDSSDEKDRNKNMKILTDSDDED